jgi:hypothetical protein
MDAGGWVALFTAVITGVVAVIGYFLTQRANRHERKSKVYAEAIQAIIRYEEIPYKVRRRSSCGAEVRAELGREISDTIGTVAYYCSLLEIESPQVGEAYRKLFYLTRDQEHAFRNDAWKLPVIQRDEEMAEELRYRFNNEEELRRCVEAMRHELSSRTFPLRRRRQHGDLESLRANDPR